MSASHNGVVRAVLALRWTWEHGFLLDCQGMGSCGWGHRGHGLCHREPINDTIHVEVDDLELVMTLGGPEGLVSAPPPQLLVLDCGKAYGCHADSQGTVWEQDGLWPWHTVTPAQIGIRKAHSVTSGISCVLWEA